MGACQNDVQLRQDIADGWGAPGGEFDRWAHYRPLAALVNSVEVSVGNSAPILADSIPAVERYATESVVLLLSDYFADGDGDPISYGAESSDETVVAVTLSGDTMWVKAIDEGEAVLSVWAADPDGFWDRQYLNL